MKSKIISIQDALAFQLRGLVYAESKVKEEFEVFCYHLSSPHLKSEIHNYVEHAKIKLLKLERIFNYLMEEPSIRKNKVINTLIKETKQVLSSDGSSHLKDILMINCLQNINAHKMSIYKAAYLFAVELQLDTAADLLQQMLQWEVETSKMLASLAVKAFNNLQEKV